MCIAPWKINLKQIRKGGMMKTLKVLFFFGLFSWIAVGNVSAYVPPLEKILEEVRQKFVHFHSLIIDQATHVISAREPLTETVYRDTVYLKTPHYARTIPLNVSSPENGVPTEKPGQSIRQPNTDALFRWILMSQPKGGLAEWLTRLGIQVWEVAYDRCDGIVSYRIGLKHPQSPKILIDKERYFPLQLSYVRPGDPENRLVTVRFSDYRKHDSGWYPHVITYAVHQGDEAEYHLLNLKANTPIEAQFFLENPISSSPWPQTERTHKNPDDARMDAIMKSLEKKYQ